MLLENAFIFLTGYPGVGKETVTDEICRLSGSVKIGGNKLSTEFFRVANYPVNELTDSVLQLAFNQMHTTFHGLLELAKVARPGTSHVFTNWLTNDAQGRADHLMATLHDVAQHRRTHLDVFALVCTDLDEHFARLRNEERDVQFKLTDPHVAQQIFNAPLYVPDGAQIVDTAGRSAEDVAEEVIDRVNAAKGPRPVWPPETRGYDEYGF